jgi:hypothetical protein
LERETLGSVLEREDFGWVEAPGMSASGLGGWKEDMRAGGMRAERSWRVSDDGKGDAGRRGQNRKIIRGERSTHWSGVIPNE